VWDLDQYACAIAGVFFGAGRAPVGQVLDGGYSLVDQLMRPLALDVRDEPNATAVVFVARVV